MSLQICIMWLNGLFSWHIDSRLCFLWDCKAFWNTDSRENGKQKHLSSYSQYINMPAEIATPEIKLHLWHPHSADYFQQKHLTVISLCFTPVILSSAGAEIPERTVTRLSSKKRSQNCLRRELYALVSLLVLYVQFNCQLWCYHHIILLIVG